VNPDLFQAKTLNSALWNTVFCFLGFLFSYFAYFPSSNLKIFLNPEKSLQAGRNQTGIASAMGLLEGCIINGFEPCLQCFCLAKVHRNIPCPKCSSAEQEYGTKKLSY